MCSVPCTPSSVPLPLQENKLRELVRNAKDWAIMHGACMRSRSNFSEDTINFAPFTLFPTTFPREQFQKAVDIQTVFLELIHKVAHDGAFLRECLKDTIKVDDFTANLFRIYETIEKEGRAQPIELELMRSDYMLDSTCDRKYHSDYPPCDWKQVEYNTIAAGFYWLGPVSGDIHRYVFQELGYDEQLKNLPENNALAGLSESLIEAWRLYGNPEGAILFVVEKVSYNICDQRFPEFKIRELNPQVKVIRRTIDELGERSRLNQNGELVIDNLLINVIYYRIGYEPASYPTQKQWDTRLLLERSKAIKCPTIHYHLAGAKKVQQELSRPGALERFLDEKQVAMVRDIFVGLYALDINEEGEKTIEMALKNPERFVLKPQREGGGNNIYGTEIREELLRMRDSKERTAWILMDRICPPITKGYMIRPGATTLPPILEMVSELGIFGVLIGNSEEILSKKQLGHMLRTKIATANEGGVAAGDGSLDSPYLLD